MEGDMEFQKTNEYRVRFGLPPLTTLERDTGATPATSAGDLESLVREAYARACVHFERISTAIPVEDVVPDRRVRKCRKSA